MLWLYHQAPRQQPRSSTGLILDWQNPYRWVRLPLCPECWHSETTCSAGDRTHPGHCTRGVCRTQQQEGAALLQLVSEHEGSLTAGTGRGHWEPETKHASLGSQQTEFTCECGLPSPQIWKSLPAKGSFCQPPPLLRHVLFTQETFFFS